MEKVEGVAKAGECSRLYLAHTSVSFQQPRPAEAVTNAHHELRRVTTRFVLAVHGRLPPTPGLRTNTQKTPLLSTPTSVQGSEN